MKCILSLTLQYFVIYTALGISRSVLDFQGVAHSQSALANALKHATDTMFYAPMVCMLFIGFRMRVLQLSKGQGAPQDYVQFAMQAVTYSILANTVLVLVVPLFTTTDLETEKTGEMKIDSKTNPFESPVLQAVFNVLRYITTLGLYVGFGTVLVGLFRYKPEDTSGVDATRLAHLSPAVGCTVMLSCAFFTIYFLLAVSRTYSQVSGGSNTFQSKFELTMTRAADTLGMAPMLCALFLAARQGHDGIPLHHHALRVRQRHGRRVLGVHDPAPGWQGADAAALADDAVRAQPVVPVLPHLRAPVGLHHGGGFHQLRSRLRQGRGGIRQVHGAVRADARRALHCDPHARAADDGQQGLPAGLGAGRHVPRDVVDLDPVHDVPDHAGVHEQDLPGGQPGRLAEGHGGADHELLGRDGRDDPPLLRAHRASWRRDHGHGRRVHDDPGDRERPRRHPGDR